MMIRWTTHCIYQLHVKKAIVKFKRQLVQEVDRVWDSNLDKSPIECKLLLL